MARRRKAVRRKKAVPTRSLQIGYSNFYKLLFGLVGVTGLGLFWKGLWDLTRALSGGESFVIGLGLILAIGLGHRVLK